MTLKVRLLPEARAEFDSEADWYESKRAGLGTEFVAEIRSVLRRIAANPRMHGVVYKNVRKAVIRRFPFIVLYQIDPSEVIVVSVFHSSRDPHDWKGRV